MAEKKPAPPKLKSDRPYADWLRLIKWWKVQSDLSPEKQGAALASSLEGRALDTVLELDDDVINSANGVDKIIEKLDILFKKNTLIQKIEDIEKFENFSRAEHKSVKDYITEFDKYSNKLKVHTIEYPEDIKGFKLLKGAKLQPNEEKLIRATITDITYTHVLTKLKDIYGDDKPSVPFNLKAESKTFYTHTETPYDEEEDADDYEYSNEEEVNDTFYAPRQRRTSFRPQTFRTSRPQIPQQRRTTPPVQHQNPRLQGASSSNWRNSKPGSPPIHPHNPARGKNPVNRMGDLTRCRLCQSINHWERECPDRNINDVSLVLNEVVLHISDDTVLKTMVSETWCSAVLDSGATNTVCGRTWFDEFASSLKQDDAASITFTESSKPFRFGDGKVVTSTKMATIPAFIGNTKVSINTDIVDADIPLLLSKTAMKNAKMQLNFDNDSLSAFNQNLSLKITTNGLYTLPITKPTQLLNDVRESEETRNPIVLKVVNEKSDREIATKLHRCFAHPSADRLLRLVNNAGEEWALNDNLKREIKEVTDNCSVCQIYKKPPPRPTVGLPLAAEFQDVVAMDLKQYNGKQILHLVDICTKLSAASFIPNKNKETIVEALFRIWLAVYGAPKKFLSDNGGEFANSEFLSLCEQFGILVNTTAAESPWSNGVVERHNQTMARSMDKIIADTGCHPEFALMWAVNAKNSLQNIAGFSPFQLVLGRNPRLPSTLTDDLPAITQRSMPELIRENLNALHSARTAFIACENDEKIRRALRNNIRSSGETKYVTGDKVFYKRDPSIQWHGPATVIGQVDQQVFIKHGSFYIRVHPCRLQLVKGATRTVTDFAQIPPQLAHNNGTSLGVPDYSTTPHVSEEPRQEVDDTTTHPPAEDQPVEIPEVSNLDTHNTQSENMPATPLIDDRDLTHSSERNTSGSSSQSSNRDNLPPKLIKVGARIRYKDYIDEPQYEGIVTSRAGKVKGANKNWWNTRRPDGSNHAVNLDQVYEWEILPHTEEASPSSTNAIQDSQCQESLTNIQDSQCQESLVCDTLLAINKSKEVHAKQIELEQWKSMDVYHEIEDNGQECISLRWVLKDKLDNSGVQFCKARLCVRGFEEEQHYRTDSPTCSREGIRLFLATAASRKWKIHSMDVKGAFLQGKELDREVLIRPPKEAGTSNLWKLKKCAYGLADAPRRWYLRLREELINSGTSPSKYDNGIFIFKRPDVQGIVLLHVDDIMWSGNEDLLMPIINKLKNTFQISHENEAIFTYIGINTTQKPDSSITLDQSSYVSSISTIPLSLERLKDPLQVLNKDETTSLRSALGQLNWLSNMTRPDISYSVSRISGHIKQAKIMHIKEANKLIKYVKDTPSTVSFPSLDIASTQVVVFSDSSFNNLDDGGSQGGQIVFLKDKFDKSCPISWRSTRVRRVARSTLAAESLSFADGVDTAAFVSCLSNEFQLTKAGSPVLGITDSRSLYDAANTSTQISDRRLRVEISAIRDIKERGELEIMWTSAENQLADVLTKKGASPHNLLQAVSKGRISLK